MVIDNVLADIDQSLLTGLAQEIGFPARPSLLADVQQELGRADPDPRVLARLASADAAMSAALMKLANSPWMGLLRPADTVERAIMLLGVAQFQAILYELVLRRTLNSDGPAMERFWDTTAKRSAAMFYLSRQHVICPSDVAHTAGLFLDVGIPLMLARYRAQAYIETLKLAGQSQGCFTEIERRRHGTDHALVGAGMARSWGVSQPALLVMRLHHQYEVMRADRVPRVIRQLLALTVVVDHIIERYQHMHHSREWEKGGSAALEALALDEHGLSEWTEDVHLVFDAGL
jgi:HD-like signal output (HDOD) protein